MSDSIKIMRKIEHKWQKRKGIDFNERTSKCQLNGRLWTGSQEIELIGELFRRRFLGHLTYHLGRFVCILFKTNWMLGLRYLPTDEFIPDRGREHE